MNTAPLADLGYLLSAKAVRERSEQLFVLAERGELEHFALSLERLPALSERVARLAAIAYPRPADIPLHGRYRHFEVGGIDRLAQLEALLLDLDPTARLAARADLVMSSVLLDAGRSPAQAPSRWSSAQSSWLPESTPP